LRVGGEDSRRQFVVEETDAASDMVRGEQAKEGLAGRQALGEVEVAAAEDALGAVFASARGA